MITIRPLGNQFTFRTGCTTPVMWLLSVSLCAGSGIFWWFPAKTTILENGFGIQTCDLLNNHCKNSNKSGPIMWVSQFATIMTIISIPIMVVSWRLPGCVFVCLYVYMYTHTYTQIYVLHFFFFVILFNILFF